MKNFNLFRNIFCGVFTWLIFILVIYSKFVSNPVISIDFLLLILFYTFIVSMIFMLCFTKLIIKNLSFQFRLTSFMILIFIFEIILLSQLNILLNRNQFLIFSIIILCLYFISLIIFYFYKKKKTTDYTNSLILYKKERGFSSEKSSL